MYLEKNREALLQTDPHAAGWLTRVLGSAEKIPTEEGGPELRKTDAGDYTLVYQGLALHDPAGAEKEAEAVVKQYCRPAPDRVHLIMGLGLGYIPFVTFHRSPGHLIIYEPNAPVLDFVLNHVDLSVILSDPRVRIATTPDELTACLEALINFSNQLDIIINHSYTALMHANVQSLMDLISSTVEERVKNFAVGALYHQTSLQQFIDNMPHLVEAAPLSQFSTYYQGKPAIVISRGPSLDAALPALKTLQDSAVLIAVGGVLKNLHAEGITPDIVVFLDIDISKQLTGLPEDYLSQILFLNSPCVSSECFTTPRIGTALYFPDSKQELAEWFNQALGETFPIISTNGTVSMPATQIALPMNCDPIVLIGQDLAFPGKMRYAGGVKLKTDKQGRAVLEQVDPQRLVTIPGQDGKPLPTLASYAGFVRQFEKLAEFNAQQPKPVKLYNASMGGAHIEGFECKPLEELIDQFTPRQQKKASIQNPSKTATGNQTKRKQKLHQALSGLKQIIEHNMSLLTVAQNQLKTAPDQASDSAQAWLSDLDTQPLLQYILMFELIPLQRQFQADTAKPQSPLANRTALTNCLEKSNALLQDLVQRMQQAMDRLQ